MLDVESKFNYEMTVAWVWVDVDGDEDDDLLLYFDPRDLDLDESDRQATLTGLTNDGVPIEGTDRVKVKE